MDTAITAVLSLLTLVAAGAALFMSPFLIMATDSSGEKPKLASLWWAFAVIWGGTAAAVIAAAVGVVKAARRHTSMWIWPSGAIVLIGVCFGIGVLLAGRVTRKSG